MAWFAQLIKQVMFWLLLAILLYLVIVLILEIFHIPYYTDTWDAMPPLPNGETARDFTDVLPKNRVNVVTDQGHYYSCRYEAAETCWVAIPREVNTPKSVDPGITLPRAPMDTRKLVYTYMRGYSAGDVILFAVIHTNGQVSIWSTRVDRMPVLDFIFYGCWGMLILAVGAGLVAVFPKTRGRLKPKQIVQRDLVDFMLRLIEYPIRQGNL